VAPVIAKAQRPMHGRIARAAAVMFIAGVARVGAQDSSTKPAVAADSSKDPHAAQPERPTVATHAGTVAPGWFELETGVERDRLDLNATVISTPTVFKIGLASRIQLSVMGTVVRPSGGSAGLGDVAVGVKWRILEDAPILGDFAIFPAIKFPTGSAETGTTTTDASALLISSHQFGDVAMDLNVGYTHRSGDGNAAPTNATLWTASFGGPFTGPLGWVAECYGFPATSGPAGAPSFVAVLAGPTFTARPWLVFDAGVIVSMTGQELHALYAGATYNVGRMWGPRR
jgi:hypothetical protein